MVEKHFPESFEPAADDVQKSATSCDYSVSLSARYAFSGGDVGGKYSTCRRLGSAVGEDVETSSVQHGPEDLKIQVQPKAFVAFEMSALQNKPVREVMEFLHMSVSAVCTAKSRCIADMKNIIANLEEH